MSANMILLDKIICTEIILTIYYSGSYLLSRVQVLWGSAEIMDLTVTQL